MPRSPSFQRPDHTFIPHTRFVGREDILAYFQTLLTEPQTRQERRILNIYGIGGQGKTALSQQFMNHLHQTRIEQGKHLTFATLSFETESYRRDASLALLALRHQLRRQGIIFPAFDTAFGRYFSLSQQGRDLETAHPELFRKPSEGWGDAESIGNDILGIVDAVKDIGVSGIPGAGLITKYLSKYSIKLRDWWQKRGRTILADLDSLEPYQISEKLPMFFASDVYEWLNEADHPERRVTLVLDTYEALWRERATKVGEMAITVDAWVMQLVNDCVGAYVVILGREPLHWVEQEASWAEEIKPWALDELSMEAAEQLLREVPIVEAEIRAAMLASSERVAFYLKLHIERYAQLKNQGKAITVEEFKEPQAQIIARFTDHMEAGLRQALKVVSCPRFVTDTLFLDLAERFLGGRAAVSFRELRQYSFWEVAEAVDGIPRYRLHNVMREQLQALLQQGEAVLLQEVHAFLFEYYDGVFERIEALEQQVLDEAGLTSKYFNYAKFQAFAQPIEGVLQELYERLDDALVEGLYHLEQLEKRRLAGWLGKRHISHYHYQSAQYSLLQSLYEHVLQITQQAVGENTDEAALCLNNLAALYKAQGAYESALPLYERALVIREQVLGAHHPDTAASLNNLAQLYQSQGAYASALPLYERALAILTRVGGEQHPHTQIVKKNYERLKTLIQENGLSSS